MRPLKEVAFAMRRKTINFRMKLARSSKRHKSCWQWCDFRGPRTYEALFL